MIKKKNLRIKARLRKTKSLIKKKISKAKVKVRIRKSKKDINKIGRAHV